MIRKYPNRRLYCPTSASYVTLAQARGRLLAGEQVFAVGPRRAQRPPVEVTAEVLATLILDEARAGVIAAEPLRKLLEHYSGPAVRQKRA